MNPLLDIPICKIRETLPPMSSGLMEHSFALAMKAPPGAGCKIEERAEERNDRLDHLKIEQVPTMDGRSGSR
jgi:hypothetical protein